MHFEIFHSTFLCHATFSSGSKGFQAANRILSRELSCADLKAQIQTDLCFLY